MRGADDWARFTEESNALDYLVKTVEFLGRAQATPTDWKWVIISLHGALYGFMICALKGTNPDNVMRKVREEKRLISFGEALQRCQDPAFMNMLASSRILELSDDKKDSLRFIREEFRNPFEHYAPRLWSIGLHGMPRIVWDGLDVVSFLALEASNYAHFNTADRVRIESLIKEGKAVLEHIGFPE